MTHRINRSRKGNYYLLIGPYDEDLRLWLRANLPPSARQWNDLLRAWRISSEYADIVRERIGDQRKDE